MQYHRPYVDKGINSIEKKILRYAQNDIQKRRVLLELVFSIKVAMTYSPTNICSTIGAVGLNFSVRDGKRWDPNAINRLNKGPITCRTFLVT